MIQDLPAQITLGRCNETAARDRRCWAPGHDLNLAERTARPPALNTALCGLAALGGGRRASLDRVKPTPLPSAGSWEHSAGRGQHKGLGFSQWRPVTQL